MTRIEEPGASTTKATEPTSKKSATFKPLAAHIKGMGGARPVFDLSSMEKAAEINVWVYASVYRIAKTLASIRPMVVETGTEIESKSPDAKRILDILRRANSHQTYQAFAISYFVHKLLDGEAFIEKGRDLAGRTNRFFIIPPAAIDVFPDSSGVNLFGGFKARIAGKTVSYGPDDIIPVINYNPKTPYRGLSPVAPIRREIEVDVNALLYNASLLENFGRPGGVLEPKEGEMFGEDEFLSIAESIREQLSGAKSAGDLLILPAGFNWKPDTVSNRDLQFLDGRRYSREAISAAFGAAPTHVNNFDSATYANAKEQQTVFWDHVGKPELAEFFGPMTEFWIQPEISSGLELVPDFKQIAALTGELDKRREQSRADYQAGTATLNEARILAGREPVAGGDVLLMPLAQNPIAVEDLGSAIAASGEPEPAPPERDAASARVEVVKASARVRGVSREAIGNSIERQQKRLSASISILMQKQSERLGDRVRESGMLPSNVDSIFSTEGEMSDSMRILVPEILAVIKAGGEETLRRFGFEKRGPVYVAKDETPFVSEVSSITSNFNLGNQRILDHIEKHFTTRIRNITETTREAVMKEIQAGLDNGESPMEIASRIEKIPVFNAARALKIAQTEVVGAYNLGGQEAFIEAGTPRKSWLSSLDELTRDSHLEAEQRYSAEPILVGDDFVLIDNERGTETELSFPGDPQAAAHETVNCRCSLVPESDEKAFFFGLQCLEELRRTMQ